MSDFEMEKHNSYKLYWKTIKDDDTLVQAERLSKEFFDKYRVFVKMREVIK